jgi:hypothetical protein
MYPIGRESLSRGRKRRAENAPGLDSDTDPTQDTGRPAAPTDRECDFCGAAVGQACRADCPSIWYP